MPPSEQALDDLWPSNYGAIGPALRDPVTLAIIRANPTPACVYLDSKALHKYGIASEHDCGVGSGPGTRIAIWNSAR
jgi:hypothetical protein